MEDDFKTFIDLENFQEVARHKLLEVVGATAKFEVRVNLDFDFSKCTIRSPASLFVQFQANLDLTVKTLDLLVSYTKLHFLLRVVENKELMLGMFGAAYQIKNKSEHIAYQRFANELNCFTHDYLLFSLTHTTNSIADAQMYSCCCRQMNLTLPV